jgi:hypothetical protein
MSDNETSGGGSLVSRIEQFGKLNAKLERSNIHAKPKTLHLVIGLQSV